MSSGGETLEQVARDGAVDYEKWPALLEPLLQCLDQIVHNAFPTPTIPPPDWLRPRAPEPLDQSAAASVNPPSPTQPRQAQRSLPPVPPFESSSSISNIPESIPPSQTSNADSIPDLLIQQLTSISQTLRTAFADKPPHTIQRLAELVLNPNKHYKTLPAWLRAVDRVVSVTSTANIFPLPQAQSLPQGVLDCMPTNGLTNGLGSGTGGGGILWTNTDTRDIGLGSDESLGGALLTPIPWLKNGEIVGTTSPKSDPLESVDPPNNAFVPERGDGAVTQGELIRMEQQAGIVPASQTTSGRDVDIDDEGARAIPYARGPDVVGVEDLGLQEGRDVELQINRGSPKAQPIMIADLQPGVDPGVDDALKAEQKQRDAVEAEQKQKQENAPPTNGDGDIVLTDADGQPDEPKADTSRENDAPDSIDTSAP